MVRKLLLGLTALSMSVTPVLAQGPASALSVRSATAAAAQEGEGGGGGSIIPPLLAGTVVIFGILLATETWPFDDDDEDPVSP